MRLTRETRFSISCEVLSQEVAGETVLLDLASEKYFGLDSVGTTVWRLLGEGKALGEIYEALLQEYEVEPDRLVADVESLLGRLMHAGLVSPEEVPGGGR